MANLPDKHSPRESPHQVGLGKILALLVVVFLGLTIFAVSLGSSSLSARDSFQIIAEKLPVIRDLIPKAEIADKYRVIVFQLRLPRIILSSLTGAGLAIVGAVFQAVFRNPLADPHILGVSSGAALGATVAIVTGLGTGALGLGGVGFLAFIFALATIGLVYTSVGFAGDERAISSMLLVGVALGTLFSAIISLLMLFNNDEIKRVYMWTLGSFNAASWDKIRFFSLIFFPCALYLILQGRTLNLLLAGEEEAMSLGLDAAKVRKRLIMVSSLLVAGSIAVSGIIGFVGLVIPQYLRILGQHDLRRQLPLSAFAGAIFLLLCDTAARTLLSPLEIPVGIITSLFGVPYFIYVIVKQRLQDRY